VSSNAGEAINLDSNATTRPSAAVVAAMAGALERAWHNPSSVHRAGQEARRAVELARGELAGLIGAQARELTLHASGTESIDQAVRGVLSAARGGGGAGSGAGGGVPIVVSTRVEHAAVRELLEHLDRRGEVAVRWLAIDRAGRVDAASAAGQITPEVALVSVQWANNETGVLQPMGAVAGLVRAARLAAQSRGLAGPLLHVDGTQWVGKLPARVAGQQTPSGFSPGGASSGGVHEDDGLIECDLLSFSAHKFHGPKGVGVLWRRPGVRLVPTLIGTQELGRRGGTENVAGIVGAGVAAAEAAQWLANGPERERLAALRDGFEARLIDGCRAMGVEARVNGAGAARLWNTSNIGFARLEAEALLLAMSERGVWASAGAACSSGSLEPSPVLLAMGVEPAFAHGSVRFSLSRETTEAELAAAQGRVLGCVERVARSMPG